MKKIQITLDDRNRVTGWCEVGSIEGGVEVTVSDDFEMEVLNHSVYEDGIFMEYEPEPIEELPTPEERLKALESAMLAMMTGGIRNV
jgi:hypothetical protein